MKKYGAYGLVEVKGESNAVIVVDRMLKTAEVEYVTQDTKCGGHALVFVGGSVSAVTAAVDEVKNNAPCRKHERKGICCLLIQAEQSVVFRQR